jgi:hypothetical protein
MDNSISINLEGTHSRDSLSFHWTAIFKDSTKINQFDEDGTEHSFKEVKEKFNELAFFNLGNNKERTFSIDLLTGIIGCNAIVCSYSNAIEKKENIRLIYFRRNRIEIGTQDLKCKKHDITYFLGVQYLDKFENNQKIILKIDSEGNWVIGE